MFGEVKLAVDLDVLYAHFKAADLKQDRILRELHEMRTHMSVQLDNLRASVTKMEDAADSMIALLRGLAAQIAALKDDPVKLQALADEVDAKAATMAGEVAANTTS